MRYALFVAQWLYFGLCCYLYPRLPDRFPTHFGIGGQPDDWSDKSLLSWFALFLVGIAVSLLLYFAGRLATNNPHMWNVPEKEKFLKLSAEQRVPIARIMQNYMTSAAIGITVLFMAVQLTMYQTATGQINTLPWYFAVVLVVTMMSMTIGAVWMNGRIGAEIKKASTAAVPPV